MRSIACVPIVLGIIAAGCAGSTTNGRAIQKSMEPTIRSGEYVSIDLHAYDAVAPRVGDIVSFHAPANVDSEACAVPRRRGKPCPRSAPRLTEERLIKRIVAGPGQRVAIVDGGRAMIDGVVQDESYITPCSPGDGCDFPRPITVRRGQYFVLGDNRPYSSDSRYWGPVPRRAIEGLVAAPDPSRR